MNMNNSYTDIDEIPHYTDISPRIKGEKCKMIQVLDIPIIIWRFELSESLYREKDDNPNKMYAKIQFSYEEDELCHKYVLGTSSYFLIHELKELENRVPFRTTIIKHALNSSSNNSVKVAYMFS